MQRRGAKIVTKKQRRISDDCRISRSPSLTPIAAAVMTALWPAAVVVAQDTGVPEDARIEEMEIEEIITETTNQHFKSPKVWEQLFREQGLIDLVIEIYPIEMRSEAYLLTILNNV